MRFKGHWGEEMSTRELPQRTDLPKGLGGGAEGFPFPFSSFNPQGK